MSDLALFTVGHGSRDLDAFLALLRAHRIQCLVDVRAYPASRRHPHFARINLAAALTAGGIRYLWEGAALGGMRRPRRDSPHTVLRDAAFRGYADHMESGEFRAAAERLMGLGRTLRTAFMCAETNPAHCHRSFIADALVGRGAEVLHLFDTNGARRHVLRAGARLAGGRLVYDSGVQLGLAF